VLSRMTDIQLLETPRWMRSNFISGLTTMPVRFKAQG
jgi:hypothetical protein